jgi:hypothetical protein
VTRRPGLVLCALLIGACDGSLTIEGRVVSVDGPAGDVGVRGHIYTDDGDWIDLEDTRTDARGRYRFAVAASAVDGEVYLHYFPADVPRHGRCNRSEELSQSRATVVLPDLTLHEWSFEATREGDGDLFFEWTTAPEAEEYSMHIATQVHPSESNHAIIDARLLLVPRLYLTVTGRTDDESGYWSCTQMNPVDVEPAADLAAGAPCTHSSEGAEVPLVEEGACPVTDRGHRTLREQTPWVTIDLGEPSSVEAVSVYGMRLSRPGASYDVLTSEDGLEFAAVGRGHEQHEVIELDAPTDARYVRVQGVDADLTSLFQVGVF